MGGERKWVCSKRKRKNNDLDVMNREKKDKKKGGWESVSLIYTIGLCTLTNNRHEGKGREGSACKYRCESSERWSARRLQSTEWIKRRQTRDIQINPLSLFFRPEEKQS